MPRVRVLLLLLGVLGLALPAADDQIELFRQLGFTLLPPQGNQPASAPAPSPTPPSQ